jgi:hypothetical protein
MIKLNYAPKHSNASPDYKLAYDIVSTLEIGQLMSANVANIKVFRKYIYDLGLKQDKEFTTKKRGENMMDIRRFS